MTIQNEISSIDFTQPQSEHEEQKLVIQWAWDMETFCPELALLYAVPNEQHLGWKKKRSGKRFNPILKRLRGEGLKPGVPDLCLPVARNGYHGFYIEIKMPGKWPSENQRSWMIALVEQGQRVDLCTSADMAIDALCDYMNLRKRFWYD